MSHHAECVNSRARIETTVGALSGYGYYRVVEQDRVAFDVLAGVRLYSVDLETRLDPGLREGRSFELSRSWADPLVGARARFDLTDTWFATAFGDIGGFGAGSDLTWQIFSSIGYQFNETWSVQAGYRHLSLEAPIDGRDVKIDLGGPLVGFTVRF